MSSDYPPFRPNRRHPRPLGSQPPVPHYESGDYTIPDGFEALPALEDEPYLDIDTDYDEAEPTTVTRARWR